MVTDQALNVNMNLLPILLLLVTTIPDSESNGQCCYFYGSAPHSDNNCVPEGQELPLNCIIHNPHDNFTNLSVRWFRRSTSDMSAAAEDIADIQSTEYIFNSHIQRMASLERNCTRGILYADTFTLVINNFTADKDGYYWCQILINGSFTQPSQRAWFYAEESNSSCTRRDPYFRAVPNSAQCASVTETVTMPTTSMDDHTIAPRITMSTTSTNDLTSTIETSTYSTALDDHANEVTTIMSIATTSPEDPIHAETTTVPITSPDVHSIAPPSTSPDDHTIAETTSMSTTSSSGHSHTTMTTTTVSSTPSVTSTLILTTLASESTVASSAPVPYYAVGILATLVLLLGTLAVLMIIFYKHKRKKEKHQRNWDGDIRESAHEETDAITSNQDTLEDDEYDAITATIDNYETVGSTATFLGEGSTTATLTMKDQEDHTYDAAGLPRGSQTDTLHEQPQYNTLQRGNTDSTANNYCSPRFDDTYDKVDIRTSKDTKSYNCSTFNKQAPRSIHQTDPYHDSVEATLTNQSKMGRVPQTVSQVYEPVYHEPSNEHCQADRPTYKQPVFDDDAYGTHEKASKGAVAQTGMDVSRFESKPSSEITTPMNKEMSTVSKEIQYAEPLVPNNKCLPQDTQGEGGHFYHSLELSEPTEPISGVPYSIKSLNPSLTMSPEEPSCAGDGNDDPDPQSCYEEDTSAPQYGDHLECMDDIDRANDQTRTTAILCGIFDDPMYA